jgi:hypothetical protein
VRLLLVWAVIAIAGCEVTTTTTDAAVAIGGCRFPRKCIRVDCDCTRATLGQCMLCDPMMQANGSCECYGDLGAGGLCTSAEELCQGRAPASCPGIGARCLPVGSSCASSGGSPPQLVPTPPPLGDGGGPPMSEPRCAFADDVCCPGAPPPDLSAIPIDMSQAD